VRRMSKRVSGGRAMGRVQKKDQKGVRIVKRAKTGVITGYECKLPQKATPAKTIYISQPYF